MNGGELIHRPVLLDEVLEGLRVRPDGIYVDGTFGRGGHSGALLERLGPEGRLLAFDKDPDAVRTAETLFGGDGRFSIVRGGFSMASEAVASRGWSGKVDGVMLDLGVSSPQLEAAERGFSFRLSGPLDMRMDPEQGRSAAQWLAIADEAEIGRVLKQYGDERFARRIARAIVARRAERPIETTGDLAALIADAVPRREPGKDPATRSFQAIRIFINDELGEVERFLDGVTDMLAPGGRLAVISFHSLEDRRVKQFIRRAAKGGEFHPDLPVTADKFHPTFRAVGKPIRPSESEVAGNPRARSAVLRVAERVQ